MTNNQTYLNIKHDLVKILNKKIELLLKYKKKSALSIGEIKKIGECVRLLSSGLTESRQLAGEKYMDKSHFLDAYLYYYYPVSYAQAYYTLKNIKLNKMNTALDIGSGPGPIATALADYGFKEITCVDYSKDALKIAADLLTGQQRKITTIVTNLEDYTPEKGTLYDCITVGHCINELWKCNDARKDLRTDFLTKLISCLNDDGLLIVIEPGANVVNREILELRDCMIDRGFFVLYPCVYKGHCPALSLENGSCHSEFVWERPELLREIAKCAGVKKEILNMTIMVFSKTAFVNEKKQYYRVVSDRMLSKSGRYRFICCGQSGRITVSVKKDLIIPCYEDFINLKRGDRIEIGDCEMRENGYALTESSFLKILDKIR